MGLTVLLEGAEPWSVGVDVTAAKLRLLFVDRVGHSRHQQCDRHGARGHISG